MLIQLSIYFHINKKWSGDNDLHLANCLPDHNFTFSIFNFQLKTRLPFGQLNPRILRTLFPNEITSYSTVTDLARFFGLSGSIPLLIDV